MEDDAVIAFWNEAKRRIHLEEMSVYLGPSPLASVPPPAWSWGEPAEADAFVDELVSSGVGRTVVSVADYAVVDEPLPEVGSMGIVLDGAGNPRVLVVTSAVTEQDGDVVQELKVAYAR